MEVQKSKYMKLKLLREELRYWQMMARLDALSLRASYKKCHEIATHMREAQKEIKNKNQRKQTSLLPVRPEKK